LRELAAKDTADADIVIVSVRGDREFAPEVKSWLDVWVGNRGTPLALVALFDPEFKDSETAQSLRRYLENISRSAQMDFFAEPEQQLGKGIMGLDTPPRFDFEDGFQETILTEDKQDDTFFPRWGIND